MDWTIDPDTMLLSRADGVREFPRAVLDSQTWPPCPRCDGPIEVDASDSHDMGVADKWLVGPRWRCDGGHGGFVS